MSTMSSGIPQALLVELREVLATCGPFDDERLLPYVFVDERIYPWAGGVPAAPSRAARIDALIEYLQDQYTSRQENALVLFLEVLRDRANARTACHHRLANLATQLAQALTATDVPDVADKEATSTATISATGNSIAAGGNVYHAARDVIINQGNGQVRTGDIL